MPICTSCTQPTPHLYTVYNSEDNLRLKQCSSCNAFADPYVEHDSLTLWIDLLLLKRDVYRHLLYNRGLGARILKDEDPQHGARSAFASNTEENSDAHVRPSRSTDINSPAQPLAYKRELERWMHTLKLGTALIAVDAFIRWTHLSSSLAVDTMHFDPLQWNQEALDGYLRILVGCFVETLGFHTGVMLSSFIILHVLDWTRSTLLRKPLSRSGIRLEFRYSHIPLTILYSSLNKLFLLFLLAIWRPASASPGTSQRPLPPQYNASNLFTNPVITGALEVLDDENLDREWIVRNVLGGMAAGFGLRVVLDCHPVFTTIVILAGWALKTALANLVSSWVGAGMADNDVAGEMWLAYSIP